MAQAAEELAAPTPTRGPRDQNGHEWGMQVAYFLEPADAQTLHADPEADVPAVGVRGILGPGCYRCKMVWDECADRPCPGDRPVEIDRMRGVGESHLWGLDRKTRRLTKHRDRKAAIREGRDPDATPEPDPRDVERDRARDEAERAAKARTRNRNQAKALVREIQVLRRKRGRIIMRLTVDGVIHERARRDLDAFDRRYGSLPLDREVDQEEVERILGSVAGLVGGQA